MLRAIRAITRTAALAGPQDRHRPFADLVTAVMTREPYATAKRVFWVVDNGSSYNGQRSIDRMKTAWPTATLICLPVHAARLTRDIVNRPAPGGLALDPRGSWLGRGWPT